nr:hypothetical protein BaRGS_022262 [Batillaria attramentaria]
MLLSHQAGLGSLGGKSISLMEYKHEWDKVEKIMSAAPPDFPPGRAVSYQSFTFGMYVDALIRRVDPKHRNLTQFFDEEIAKPYDIDFHIGLPHELYYRAARQYFAPPWMLISLLLDPPHYPLIWDSVTNRNGSFMSSTRAVDFFNKHKEILNDPYQMEVGIGSMIGFSSARSLAKLYDTLANGGKVKDKQLLPQNLIDLFSIPLTESVPPMLSGHLMLFSVGFQVSRNKWGTHFGHDGYGGQQASADIQRKLGMAYTTNFHWTKMLTAPDHYLELENLFYECYEKHQAKSGEKK